MAQQQFKKCIECAYAVWPVHAPGFCTAHNIETSAAREQSAPCGWDAASYQPIKQKEPENENVG